MEIILNAYYNLSNKIYGLFTDPHSWLMNQSAFKLIDRYVNYDN